MTQLDPGTVRRRPVPSSPGALLFLLLSVVALGARCDGNGLPVKKGGGIGGVFTGGSGGGPGAGGGGGAGGIKGCGGAPVSAHCSAARLIMDGRTACDDVLQPLVCSSGSLVCPQGTVPTSQCDCFQDCWGTGGSPGEGTGGSPPDSGSGCDGSVVYCPSGRPGGDGGLYCDDVAYPASCTNGAWVCPPGTYRNAQCTCYNVPIGANCPGPDAGAVDAPPIVDSGPVVDATPPPVDAVIPCGDQMCAGGVCVTYSYGDDASPANKYQCFPLQGGCGDCGCLCKQACGLPWAPENSACSCDALLTTATCRI
jgi:hypothetical protein